jgi:hypothetical protein
MAEHVHRALDRVDHRHGVSELGVDRVGIGVRTRSPPAAVDRHDRETLRKGGRDRRPSRVISRGAMHKNKRRTRAAEMAADLGPVERSDVRELGIRWVGHVHMVRDGRRRFQSVTMLVVKAPVCAPRDARR